MLHKNIPNKMCIRDRYGIVVSAENAFSFNASYYTQEELEEKTHNYELAESDSVVFCVDYALNGIGSNSCLLYTSRCV